MSDGKVVVISGATGGIGRACAIGLSKAGYRVAIFGRRQKELDEAAAGQRRRCLPNPATRPTPRRWPNGSPDSRPKPAGSTWFSTMRASSPRPTNFGDLEVSTWQEMVNVNLNGAFYVAREAFRAMRDQTPQGGRIINNGSISAYMPRPQAAAYTATKHAITGLTRAISLDGRAYNIACGQIDIGNTATDMTARMSGGSLQADLTMKPEPTFNVQHVVDAIVYMANLPLEVNVQFMTVMATTMPYIGRG